jgi:hypothetical protein
MTPPLETLQLETSPITYQYHSSDLRHPQVPLSWLSPSSLASLAEIRLVGLPPPRSSSSSRRPQFAAFLQFP